MTLHGRDRLEAQADTGLGADELGLRRFTRVVEQAEARALTDHQTGRCAESEWSCSHCEADQTDPRGARHFGEKETPGAGCTRPEGNPTKAASHRKDL